VTRGEIGAIRIGQAETWFQIPRALADKYAATAARTGETEGDEQPLIIERSEAGPREAARTNRQRRPSRSTADRAFVKAKPPVRGFAKPDKAASHKVQPGPGPGAKHGKPAHKHKRKPKPTHS
jgi:ATP-dependent RNA helicase DeaD